MTMHSVRGGVFGAASVYLLATAGLGLTVTLPVFAQKSAPDAAHGSLPGPHAAKPSTTAVKPAAQPAEKPAAAAPAPPANASPAAPGPAASPPVEVTTPDDSTINIHISPRREEPPSNNWAVGVLGLALLAAAVYFGLRYARQRGMTVPEALKRLGVEMPQDALAGAPPNLKPAPAPLPPLPSLGDLPVAGPAAAGTVTAAPPRTGIPRLLGLEGAVAGESFDLVGVFTVGREADNSLALTQDTTVSRRHARFEGNGSAWSVMDEGSSNGTYVNGRRISGTQPLQPGDVVQIGTVRLRFED